MNRFLCLMIVVTVGFAAQAGSVSIESLYPEPAFVTDRHIPFRVKATDPLKAGDVKSVRIEGASADDCRGMVDPFRFDLIQILCKKPSPEIFIIAEVVEGQTRKANRFGPLKIVAATIIDDGTDPLDPDPVPLTPQQIFENNCTGCHHTKANLKTKDGTGITTAKIQRGITNQPVMSHLSTLSTVDLQKIVDYVMK